MLAHAFIDREKQEDGIQIPCLSADMHAGKWNANGNLSPIATYSLEIMNLL